MRYVVVGRDGADALGRRMAVREAHLAQGKRLAADGTLLYAAALLDEDGNMAGSMMVMDFASEAVLQTWLETEPYVTGEVWETVDITPCAVSPLFDQV